ncbi:ArsR/SmtB family transcription factor [Arenibacterium sp. CAU 1754]
MKDGPNIASVAALIGDPARANILTALMSGKALTASELAGEAGVTAQTASSHLRKLEEGGLIARRNEGRHKYFTLSGDEVARALEGLMGLAAGHGHLRTRTGPRDHALRTARVCYNHLAGEMGVQMFRSMQERGHFTTAPTGLNLTRSGADFVRELGIDPEDLPRSKAPLCRECLDWSMRQSHLAGRLGRAMLSRFEETKWVRRLPDSRVLEFSRTGQHAFDRLFGEHTG